MATVPGTRPRYYEGQYLSADDLSVLVDYLRTSGARHALGGHTWGIAIGLQLTERSAPGGQDRVEVNLQPGFAWDGFGRPIANGRPTAKSRPWLGINTQEVQGNVIVTRVSPESPADSAGLQAGDVIVGIRGQEIKGQADFYTKIWESGEAGVEIPVDVLKGSRIRNFSVKSIEREKYLRAKPVY